MVGVYNDATQSVLPLVDVPYRRSLPRFECHRCTSQALEHINRTIKVFHTRSHDNFADNNLVVTRLYVTVYGRKMANIRNSRNVVKLSACANSGYQALSPRPTPKRLGTRLSETCALYFVVLIGVDFVPSS